MSTLFNVYCDESSHLENDDHTYLVLGAVWCDEEVARTTAERIREIKASHGIWSHQELKWGKVSPSSVELYRDVIDYFFDSDDLHFRALVADKRQLRHEDFEQTHDDWYYKMYFSMLKVLFRPPNRYRIYIDIKDTRSAEKMARLHEVLCNNQLDFDRRIIQRVQPVRSHEVEQVQVADLLIGAVAYANRGLRTSEAKRALVERVQERSRKMLTRSTLLGEQKVNIFVWQGQE